MPNILIDGGFEIWASPTNLTHWIEYLSGTNTINREASVIHSGSYACRLDIDAGGGYAQPYQGWDAVADRWYRVSFWYRTDAGKKISGFARVTIGAGNYYLQPDGVSWLAAPAYSYADLESTAWARHEFWFKTPANMVKGSALWGVFNHSSALSSSLYVDDAHLDGPFVRKFDDLAASPIAAKDFLAEIQPREWIQEWTKSTGYTNVYAARFFLNDDLSLADQGRKEQDGGLEQWTSSTDLTRWTEEKFGNSTIEQESVDKVEGSYSCKMDNPPGAMGADIYQMPVAVKSGKLYRFSGWYKGPLVGEIWIYTTPYPDFDYKLYGTLENHYWRPAAAGRSWVALPASADWTRFKVEFRVPEGYTGLLIAVGQRRGTGTFYFDDLRLEGIGEPDYYGKIYRRLDGVSESGTDYTERTSLALVDANAGSYYHDAANGWLYIHALSSGNPNSVSAYITARFTVFFSSGIEADGRGKIMGGIFYEPLFNSNSIPEIEMEQSDFLTGGGIAVTSIEAEFTNPFRFWDKIIEKWIWKNAPIRILFGGEALPLSEYALIFAGKIIDERWLEDRVSFECVDNMEIIKRNIPVNPLFGDNVREQDQGRPIPLLFGDVEFISPLCVDDSTASATVWQIADPAFQTLYAIDKVFDGGVDRTSFIVRDLANCKFSFSGYAPTGDVTCNATGAVMSDIPGESGSDPITNAADILRFLLMKILNVPASDIDAASFAAAKTETADVVLAKLIRYRRNMSAYIEEIERSVFGNLHVTPEGKFGFDIFSPLFDEDDVVENWEFEPGFSRTSPLQKMYSGVKVFYRPLPIDRPEGATAGEDDAYLISEGTNPRALYIENQEAAFKQAITWIRDSVNADMLRDRIRFLTSLPAVAIDAGVRGIRLFRRRPGDVLKITKTIAPSITGRIANQYFQIIKIIKEFAGDRCSIVLDNFQGTIFYVGSWTDDSAPNWSAASDEEKDKYGFWANDDGFIDPADPASKNRSLWY